MSEPDYRAMWEELKVSLARWGGAPSNQQRGLAFLSVAKEMVEMLARMDKVEKRTPDPDHVPAVRRVVAWEACDPDTGDGPLYRERKDAYRGIAQSMTAATLGWDAQWHGAPSACRLWRRVMAMREGGGKYLYRVQARIESLLRHRDEEAGYR